MEKWTELTEVLSQMPILENITRTKQRLDALRPLPVDIEQRVMQKIRLDWNFHSNAIEGNKLTFGETYTFLMHGLTAKGKPLKDHLDIKGHNEAILFLKSLVKIENDLTEMDIRSLHSMILVEPYQSEAQTPDGQATTKTIRIGAYKQQPNHVLTQTGEIHYYADPIDVPILMSELVDWFNIARKNPKIHPSVLATFFHHRFVNIHPFDDGNGRLSRILMNLILMQKGYVPAVIKLKERTDYYAALSQADKNEFLPIVEFVAEEVLNSLNLYLKAARGESIEEDDDLDKEIALFKGSFENSYKLKTKAIVLEILNTTFFPIIEIADRKLSKFNELFLRHTTLYGSHFLGSYEEFEHEAQIVANYEQPKDSEISVSELENILNDKHRFASFDGIYYLHRWNEFVKTKNNIEFSTQISLIFNRTDFQVKFEDKILLSKNYDEVITDLDRTRIANEWARLSFENLKKVIGQELNFNYISNIKNK
jgi:Fic family protein